MRYPIVPKISPYHNNWADIIAVLFVSTLLFISILLKPLPTVLALMTSP